VIVGIGADRADISRLDAALRRTPAVAARLFTDIDLGAPVASLAGCFAAKDAVAKVVAQR
jgi:holo-[acyl-carrier protein] synthase